jgi:hypothetical protein
MVARKQKRETRRGRAKIYPSKTCPSDLLTSSNQTIPMKSSMHSLIDEVSTFTTQSCLNSTTNCGPSLQHMSLGGVGNTSYLKRNSCYKMRVVWICTDLTGSISLLVREDKKEPETWDLGRLWLRARWSDS